MKKRSDCRRLIALVLAMVLMLSLAACGGTPAVEKNEESSATSSTTSSTTSSSTASSTETAEEPLTFTMFAPRGAVGYGLDNKTPYGDDNKTLFEREQERGNLKFDVTSVDPNEAGEGEILVKGPNVMLGYYKDEEATREAMDEDGYFKTGDYGRMTSDRVLYITGRKKNLIILSNGKNVYPEEIEKELIAVPGIQDVVVYEGKSRRGQEYNAIVAEIFPDKDYIEKNGITDVKAHLQPYIADFNRNTLPYKKISVVKIRKEDFPKNTLRKIMRFKLDTSID